MTQGALHGIRILDLTWGGGAAVGVTMLAEHGADVIKVEPPGGDPFREYHGSAVWHRSRRSIALDLTTDADKATLWDLIASAHVLVESFRPGKMDKLGFGYDAVHERFPALIYCSISGFPVGHRYEQRSGWDALVQAAGGAQFEQPAWRMGPIYNHAPTPSLGTMFLAPIGILSALHQRSATGRGQHVRTSLLQGLFLYTTQIWQDVENVIPGFHELMQKSYPPGIHQAYIYQTADGWVHYCVQSGLTPTKSVEEILGLDQPHPYAQAQASAEERAKWQKEREDAYRTWKTAELVKTFQEHNHAIEPIITAEEALAEPHAQLDANQMVAHVTDPELGATTQMGVPIHLLGTPGAITSGRPRLNEHGDQLRLEVKDRATSAVVAPPTRAPLDPAALGGLRLVDYGQYLAGPFGPMLLGDLGMDVIKIEPVTGDNMRMASAPFQGCARGKRSLALNLKDPRGKEIALEIVKTADVVHHNMTKGVATRLGIDYAASKAVKPDIIYCNTYAYGLEGPLSHSGGLDPIYQASSGIEWEQAATHLGNKPLYVRFGFTDQANAVLSVVGVLLALAHRDRTGEGQELWTSLLDGGATFASDALLIDGEPVERPHIDGGFHGLRPDYRLYRCQDEQYVQIVATKPQEWAALLGVLGLNGVDQYGPREEVEAILEQAFLAQTSWQWKFALDRAGVPVELPLDTQRGMAPLYDADNVRLGLVTEYEHPIFGRTRQIGNVIDFSETPGRIYGPAPLVGQHTREVLDGIGLNQREIDELVGSGVAYEPGPDYRERFTN